MNEQFIEDQKRWQKDWSKNFFLYMARFISILTLLLILWLSSDLIELMKKGIESWSDARGLGFFLGGVVAPFVTFMGLHLSSTKLIEQNKQTKELQKQNSIRDVEHTISQLSQALALISESSSTNRIFGLALFRQPGLASNRSLLEASHSALRDFAELHHDNETAGLTVVDPSMTGPRHHWQRLEASEALHSFLFLSSLRFKISESSPTYARLDAVNFARPILERVNFRPGAEFRECSFHWAQFFNLNLETINFESCDFSSARFIDCKFTAVSFKNCEISSLVTNSEDKDLYTDLCSSCLFLADKPPHVPVGTLLPVPDVEDKRNNVARRKMTIKEARGWEDPRLAPKFDESGELLGMEYTGSNRPINQPRPDRGPSLSA